MKQHRRLGSKPGMSRFWPFAKSQPGAGGPPSGDSDDSIKMANGNKPNTSQSRAARRPPPLPARRATPSRPTTGSSGRVQPEAPKDPYIGTTLNGRYAIMEQIGTGGMGLVYKAHQIAVDRMVAVKIVLPNLVVDTQTQRRFQFEARAASKLRHPNTITVHDFGQAPNGALFIVMELLRGRSLDRVLSAQGALPWRRAVGIVLQICGSLGEAHKMGIVHRDIKPSNIFLANIEGQADFVKVLDLGIAKTIGSERLEKNLTEPGMIIGSARYMAPEQFEGGKVKPTADIYALGVLTFEALTGRPIFEISREGFAQEQFLFRHLTERPRPLAEVRPDLDYPAGLQTLLDRMLAKQPEQRPQSTAEIVEALQKIVDASSGSMVTPSQPIMRELEISGRFDIPDAGGITTETRPGTKTVERLVQELDAFVNAGLLGSALEHLRIVLARAPENPLVLNHARRLYQGVDKGQLGPDELIMLKELAHAHPGAAETEAPAEPPPRPLDTSDMVFVPAARLRSFASGALLNVRSFYVDRTPVTNVRYAEFLADTGELAPHHWLGSRPPEGKEDHPVVAVSKAAAERYAQWAGKRLPTASEWELAARGPKGRAFPWGEAFDESQCHCRKAGVRDTASVEAHPGGATPEGCLDLVGNVWEWTDVDNANSMADESYAWVYGGSYRDACHEQQHLVRTRVGTGSEYAYLGFRCAANEPEAPT